MTPSRTLLATLALGALALPAAAQTTPAAPSAPPAQTPAAQSAAQAVTLAGAVGSALANNPDVRSAQNSLQEAQANLRARESDPSTLILDLTQARGNLTRAQAQLAAARLSALQNVVTAYTALLEAQENSRVQEQQVAFDRRNLEVARVRLQNRNATPLDVRRAETTLADSEATLVNLRGQLPVLSLQLSRLSGGSSVGLRASGLPPSLPGLSVTLAGLLSGIENRASDLVGARLTVEVDQLNVRLSDNDFTPQRTLQNFQTTLANDVRALEDAAREKRRSVQDAYRSAQSALAQVEVARATEANARATAQQNQTRFAAGTISALDLQNGQVALRRAEFTRLQAQTAVLRALAALSVAAGQDVTGLTGGGAP